MTPQEFIAKWKRSKLSERSASHEHFLDLCAMLNEPTPAAADPDGTEYTFERGVTKTGGGKGWADVWKRHYFAWEYKGKHKDLVDAYNQLLRYREDLENPWLLVVCDMDRFEVHTNFPNTVKTVHEFDLDTLAEPKNLEILRKVFTEPASLEPKQTPNDITEQVAKQFAKLAEGMRKRNIPADRAAHFLMKLMFCMFAEDIGLLEGKLFGKILASVRISPTKLSQKLRALFEAMSKGGDFGADTIRHFDGGLFNDADVIDLELDEIEEVIRANDCDWSNVEPTIFGTLFERTLDPDKRSQIGAHFTSQEDIRTLLEPVLMAPLRREWEQAKANAEKAYAKLQESARAGKRSPALRTAFEKILIGFLDRLTHIKILDPSCGSGNFLYVAIKLVLDLEKEVITYGANHGFSSFPHVEPTQLLGIEINPYAQQLAQVVIWIGYLQWLRQNGFGFPAEPILKPFENIQRRDAIIDLTDPANPKEPEWPDADFIVGNPPFLGSKKHREKLGEGYTNDLLRLYKQRVQGTADLCAYWFEKTRKMIADGRCNRAGLLATQTIRGTASRQTLARIKDGGDIFFAISDRDWILDGAAVHVSIVGFDSGSEQTKTLDGLPVLDVHINLKTGADLTSAKKLRENDGKAFMGDTKGGTFQIDDAAARVLLCAPNAHGRPNSDVVVPWANAADIAGESRDMWIIDFGLEKTEAEAALYELPFEFLRCHVYAERQKNRREAYRDRWWLHVEARPGMRAGLSILARFFVTTITSKHRLFFWMQSPTLPDHKLIAFAYEDDYSFGVLHGKIHRVWTHGDGSQVREKESGFTYIPTTNFMTFPFPMPTDAQRDAIAQAAKEFDMLRSNWLNPPEWTKTEILEFPGSEAGPWARYVHNVGLHGIGTVFYPRQVPKDEKAAANLKKRTLTNLYNQRPTWLDLAHKKLDAAVFAAYGWEPDMTDDEILAALLALNLERAAKQQDAGVKS